MHFASLKVQDRRIGDWNWPRITRIKQIFADFSNRCHAFSAKIRVDPSHQRHPWRIETPVIHKIASKIGDKFITGSNAALWR